MDGLDDMMAEIEAEESRKQIEAKAPRPAARSAASGGTSSTPMVPVAAAVDGETERRLVARLEQLRLDLADPSVRQAFAADLSQRDPQEALSYYLARPELSQYTVEREVPRMVYRATAREGGSVLSGAEAIVALHAADAKRRGAGEDRGPEVLWRMANQSIFAEALEVMHRRVVVPHDDGGSLCLGVGTEGVEFEIYFDRGSLRATCSLALTTITDGGASRLSLAKVALAVEVDVTCDGVNCSRFFQSIESLKPEFVFDEQLAAAAKTLAELSPEDLDAQRPTAPDFAALRAANALSDATSNALGAAATASAQVLGGLRTLSLKAAAAASSAAEEAAAAKAAADSSERDVQRERDELDELFDNWETEETQPEASAPAVGLRGFLDRLVVAPSSPSAGAAGEAQQQPTDAGPASDAPGNGAGRAPFGVMGLLDRLAGPGKAGSAGGLDERHQSAGGTTGGEPEGKKNFGNLFDRLG